MKILVTGGAGFIGSNFIKYILKKYPDYQIINLDKLTYCGNLDNLRDIENDPRYQFIKGDICDSNLVDKIISQKPEVVVNFAAESHVDRSILDSNPFLKTNILGTYTLLETVKKYRIGRFIQISTDEVYGSINEDSFREMDLLNPSNLYSSSKAAADIIARSYYITYKMPKNSFGKNKRLFLLQL